jgi:hypothetical protein
LKKGLHILALFALIFCSQASAQKWYSMPKQNNEKYLVYVAYGMGNAHWYSELIQTSIYDQNGSAITNGDAKFRAKNSSQFYDLGVIFPAGNLRFGLGMNFEKFFLTQILLQNSVQQGSGQTGIIFDESFRFDKIYMQMEVPFWPEARSKYSLSANMNLGFFSFNNVDRINLFGSDALANSTFVNISPVADVTIFPGVSLFLRPVCEFKYFKNQAVDSPGGVVKHNILTYSLMIGLRYDPSVVDELK